MIIKMIERGSKGSSRTSKQPVFSRVFLRRYTKFGAYRNKTVDLYKRQTNKQTNTHTLNFISAKEKPQKGAVIAVGPGKKDEPMTVKVGDNVLYGKYSGTELHIDGKLYLIMKESDIYVNIR